MSGATTAEAGTSAATNAASVAADTDAHIADDTAEVDRRVSFVA